MKKLVKEDNGKWAIKQENIEEAEQEELVEQEEFDVSKDKLLKFKDTLIKLMKQHKAEVQFLSSGEGFQIGSAYIKFEHIIKKNPVIKKLNV